MDEATSARVDRAVRAAGDLVEEALNQSIDFGAGLKAVYTAASEAVDARASAPTPGYQAEKELSEGGGDVDDGRRRAVDDATVWPGREVGGGEFDRFYRATLEKVYARSRMVAATREDAEDLTHRAYVEALRSPVLGGLAPGQQVSWMYTTVTGWPPSTSAESGDSKNSPRACTNPAAATPPTQKMPQPRRCPPRPACRPFARCLR
jgi:hypothetical protein